MEGTCTSIRWLSGESCLPQRAASACRRPASVLPFDSQERAGRDYDPSTRLGKLFHKSKRKQISPHCLAAVLTVWLQSSLSGCSPHCLTAVLTVSGLPTNQIKNPSFFHPQNLPLVLIIELYGDMLLMNSFIF